MASLRFGNSCPFCAHKGRRLKRKRWMRFLPGAKYFHCSKCGAGFLLIFGALSVKV